MINSANDDDNASHRKLINEFNNVYSVVNNLNIKINLTPVTPINSTPDIRNYGDMFSSSLAKEKKDFDLVHFYSAYSKTYGEFFEDLRKYLPEDILNEYDKTMLEKACTNKDDKLVGLVMYIINIFLYIYYYFLLFNCIYYYNILTFNRFISFFIIFNLIN